MRLPPTPSTAASVVGATASFSAVVTSEEHDSDMPSSSSSPPVTTSANATESKIVIVPSSSASNITDTGIDTRLVAMNDKETDSKSTLSDDTSNGKIAVIKGLEISTAKTKTEIEEEDIEDRMDVEVAEERKSNEQLDGKEDQDLLAVYVKQENRENIITVEKGEGTASNVLSVARDEIDVTMMIEDSVPTPVKGEGEEDSAPTTTATSTSTLVSLEEKGENIIINMVALESEIEVAESKYLTSSSSSISPAPQVELIKTASLPPTTLPRAPDFLSAIHGLRGYLDVGSDALYTSTEPWVPATASLLAKRKLARN